MINQREAVTEAVALLASINGFPSKARYAIEKMSNQQITNFVRVLQELHTICVDVLRERTRSPKT